MPQGWKLSAETQTGQSYNKAIINAGAGGELTLNKDQVRKLVGQLVDIVALLAQTDRSTKAEIYAELGVKLIYKPDARKVQVETLPRVYSGRVDERT